MKKFLFLVLFGANLTAQVPYFRVAGSRFSDRISIDFVSKNSKILRAKIDSAFYLSRNGGTDWQKVASKHDPNFFIESLPKSQDSIFKFCTPAQGLNGEIFTCGIRDNELVFQKSEDKGKTWLEKEIVVASAKNAASYKINGLYASNGLPTIACDLSNSPNRGRIYICWSDEKSGQKNKDVFVAFTDNKGEIWSEPTVVTYYQNHKEQFMPSLAVDQSTGYVYIVYLDQKNYFQPGLTDVTLAISKNGCQKFDYITLNKSPIKGFPFGKNTAIAAAESEIRPMWQQTILKGKTATFVAIVNDSVLNESGYVSEIVLPKMLDFSRELKVEVTAKHTISLSAALYKPLDPSFEKLVFENKKLKAGNNNLLIKTAEMGLENGTYVLILYYNNKTNYVWITAN